MLARRPTDDREVGVELVFFAELAVLSPERVLLLRPTGVNVLSGAGPSSVGATAPASPSPRFIAAISYVGRDYSVRGRTDRQANTPVRVSQGSLLASVGTSGRSVGCCFQSTTISGSKTETSVCPSLPSYHGLGQRRVRGWIKSTPLPCIIWGT